MTGEVVLRIGAMMPAIERLLDERFTVHAVPGDATPDLPAIAAAAGHVRGVATSGHYGITPALIDALPALGIVALNAVGFDRVDLDHARARGIRVTNTPDVLSDDVADLAIALLLNCKRRLPAAERHVRDGAWPAGPFPLARRASGLRYGIVGLGRIGHAIASRLHGFGGTIAYTGPRRKPVTHAFHERLVDLAAAVDVLFLALPASAGTRGLIDAAVLDALGPDGTLINIARGAVVDEPALVEALASGRLGGAGLDVFDDEPNVPAALRDLPNVALAPHVGSATNETRLAMGELMIANLEAFFAGRELLTPIA